MTTPPSFTLFPHLLDDITIREDGTLSRVLFKGDALRVVVVAFDAGQELADHTVLVPAILQVVQGQLPSPSVTRPLRSLPTHRCTWRRT